MSQLLMHEPRWTQQTDDRGLLVTWQNPNTRRYILLGRLGMNESGSYEFKYFASVEDNEDFRPIPGFRDPKSTYTSTVMFPFFSGRLMGSKRPDRPEWLSNMGLNADAAPFEILGRSFGHRVADTYELFREPDLDLTAKTVAFVVPVHGLRHQDESVLNSVNAGEFAEGSPLNVVLEKENPFDPRARQLLTTTDQRLGYVPTPVLDYLALLGFESAPATATVEHINPEHVGHHLRVIVKVTWHV